MVWEASDRICGKRRKAALPNFVDSMERHGHLSLDPVVRERLLSASAATLDRLLRPIRATSGSRRKRGRRAYMGSQIPVRTYNDWNWPPPGFLEIDLVAHCVGNLSGSFIHSLVATDICTGWKEAVPLLAREQSLVVVLARCEYVQRRENVIAVGNSGTDKTHVTLGLGLAACQRGLSVGFTTAAGLVHELMEARDERRLLNLQRQLARLNLLIIDELGFVPLSRTGAELLFEVFSQRYERGSIMVTTTCPSTNGPRSSARNGSPVPCWTGSPTMSTSWR